MFIVDQLRFQQKSYKIFNSNSPEHVSFELRSWIKEPEYCGAHPYTCTSNGFHYPIDLELEDPCNILRSTRKRKILFCGDSFIRHAYQGFILLLTQDYSHGGVINDNNNECLDEMQFHEKKCRFKIPDTVNACGGEIQISLRNDNWCTPTFDHDLYLNDVVVWGFGNHPVDGNYETRNGIFNVEVSKNVKLLPFCSRKSPLLSDKIIHLTNHVRLDEDMMAVNYPDSKFSAVQKFTLEINDFLRNFCNITNIVDTFNMTMELIKQEPEEVLHTMSYDGAHWGRLVNIVKAQMILEQIALHMTSS